MVWYNNLDAVQAAHDRLVREHRRVAHRRHLLRLVADEASEATPVL